MPVNGGTSFTLLCSIHTGGADHRGAATQLSNTLGLDAPVADGFLVFASLTPLPQRREGRTEDLVGHQFRREQPLENEALG
jgi:hypothetical protein